MGVELIEPDNHPVDSKIGDFFSYRRKSNSRNAIAYTRSGDFVVIQFISNGVRQDKRNFEIGKDDVSLCRFLFDKHSVDIKEYQKKKRRDDVNWQ